MRLPSSQRPLNDPNGKPRLSINYFNVRDLRLPLRCKWDLHSSGMSRSIHW